MPSMNRSKTVIVKHATSTWRQIHRHWVEMSSNTAPTLIPTGPQPSSGPEQSVITANRSQAGPAWRRGAQTFSPFALLMALRGLRTLRTLRIFTTEMALDLGEGREQSVLQVDKTCRFFHLALTLLPPPHTMSGPLVELSGPLPRIRTHVPSPSGPRPRALPEALAQAHG